MTDKSGETPWDKAGEVVRKVTDKGRQIAGVAMIGTALAVGAPQWSSGDFEFRFPAADAADSKFKTSPEFQKNAQKLGYKVGEAILARMRVANSEAKIDLKKARAADPELAAIAIQYKTLKVGEVTKSLTYSKSQFAKMWTGLRMDNVDRVEVSFFKKDRDDRTWLRFKFMDDDDVLCEVDVPHKQSIREEIPEFDK